MHTRTMIAAVMGAVALLGIVTAVLVMAWLGPLVGGAAIVGAAVLGVAGYGRVLRPWHLRWGALDAEVASALPGDELDPQAPRVTRAISVRATPEELWPWVAQIGWGRAGWYSYDWIDNDFRPSADRILPEHQELAVGDTILMMPGHGFEVVEVAPTHHFVCRLPDGSVSWTVAIRADGEHSRLLSRWRPTFPPTVGGLLARALTEPGAFVMEQKMLRTIRDRAESVEAVAR